MSNLRVQGDLYARTRLTETMSATTISATGTLSAAAVWGGIIVLDASSGAVTATLPTAALLVAAKASVRVGDCVKLHVVNTDANALTLAAGSGVTLSDATAVAANTTKEYILRFTNVTSGSEAVTVY